MPTTAQLLKASGDLLGVSITDLDSAALSLENLGFVAENNFCGFPTTFDQEIIDTEPKKLSKLLDISVENAIGLRQNHAAIKAAATGVGSYPAGCNPDYPGLHAVAYYDDPNSWLPHLKRPLTDAEFQSIIDAKVWGPSGDPNGKPFTMRQLKEFWGSKPLNQVVNDFSEETFRRVGPVLYPVFTGPEGQHNIHVRYPIIAGNVIGRGWFPGNDPCPGDHVNLEIDKTYTSGFQGQLGLKIHELGHTLKLQHQFNNQDRHQEPLSYRYRNHLVVGFSTGEPVFGLPRAPSLVALTRYYGGEPVGIPWKGMFDNTPTPEPPPIPTPIGTTTIILSSDMKAGTYRVSPTGSVDGPITHG